MTQDNCDKFIKLAKTYKQTIKFYNLEELNQILLSVNQTGTRTVGNLYRLLIHYVIPKDLHKIIFSYSDIIVNLDINKLWKNKVNDVPLAGVPEVDSYVNTGIHAPVKRNIVVKENYFNAGLLVINLDIWRKESKKNYLKLPKKFNTLVQFARIHNDFETDDRICHYITSSRGGGFGLDTNDAFNKLFLKYFIKTPWFSEDSIGRLYDDAAKY